MLKDILLFILACGLAGISIFAGSVLGNAFGKTGLFVGAVVGGVLGVAASILIARASGLLDGAGFTLPFVFAVVAFGLAAIIAVNNLSGPVIPIASTSLVGIGAVAGKKFSLRRS